MKSPPHTDAALKRFLSALDHLEAAIERRAGPAQQLANMQEELAVMQDDRARLAAELDAALKRNNSLGLANDEVAARLDKAAATIAAVLAQNQSTG